jgi:UDP-3-O-[3-hydroxymyristoyl] N-acetylglucosamine deacetylase
MVPPMLSGYGLHTGVFSQVRLHQAEGEVRFRLGKTEIPARLESVVATPRCTVLGQNGVTIALVEHLLAALYIKGWWKNVLIEVEGGELPILDGSAAPWLEEIASLGKAPEKPKAFYSKLEVDYQQENTHMLLTPAKNLLSVSIEFSHPAIGKQSWQGQPEQFDELLSARTFGFKHEYEALRTRGLASHVSLENAIVFDDEGPLSPLRFPDEPVRHKALDVLGDIFLLGRPLHGKLLVSRGSHQHHLNFMKQLLASSSLSVSP